jgi:hypothetical protein
MARENPLFVIPVIGMEFNPYKVCANIDCLSECHPVLQIAIIETFAVTILEIPVKT